MKRLGLDGVNSSTPSMVCRSLIGFRSRREKEKPTRSKMQVLRSRILLNENVQTDFRYSLLFICIWFAHAFLVLEFFFLCVLLLLLLLVLLLSCCPLFYIFVDVVGRDPVSCRGCTCGANAGVGFPFAPGELLRLDQTECLRSWVLKLGDGAHSRNNKGL